MSESGQTFRKNKKVKRDRSICDSQRHTDQSPVTVASPSGDVIILPARTARTARPTQPHVLVHPFLCLYFLFPSFLSLSRFPRTSFPLLQERKAATDSLLIIAVQRSSDSRSISSSPEQLSVFPISYVVRWRVLLELGFWVDLGFRGGRSGAWLRNWGGIDGNCWVWRWDRGGKCKAMHGCGGEERRKRIRHMWKSPTRGNSVVSVDVSSSSSSSSSSSINSFYKVSLDAIVFFL